MRNDDDTVIGVIFSVRDITERKELGGAFAAYLDGEPVAAYLAFVLWLRKKRIERNIGRAPGVG